MHAHQSPQDGIFPIAQLTIRICVKRTGKHMEDKLPLAEITATLPGKFFEHDAELPFDSTYGTALAQQQRIEATQKRDGSDAIEAHTMVPDVLQLPPYHYTSREAASPDQPQATRQPAQGWVHDFEPLGLLGEGGEGQVRLARQSSLQREVAIKGLRKEKESKAGYQRLLGEALIMGSLEHPNVIPIHGLGRDIHDRPFIVMKKVSGDTWRELLRDDEHKAWERLRSWSDDMLVRHLEILMQVCNALEHAHSYGILHRDIKPSNIMVGEFGEVYLLDWGIACRSSKPTNHAQFVQRASTICEEGTRKALLSGTPAYMAPEMFLCDQALVDQRTDVYLLGATLYEIIEKRPPHEGASLQEHMEAALRGPHFEQEDDLLQELVEVCKKALAPEPDQRFPNVETFRKALASFLRHRTSVILLQQAKQSHQQLDTAIANATTESLLEVYDLFIETRFAYLQALDEWPENQRATAGFQRCLEQMIRFHIEHERLSDAIALLQRLPEARPELEQQIHQLQLELETREKQQQETIRKLRLELDSSLSHKERMLYVLAIGAPSVLASIFVFLFKRKATILTTPTLLWLSLFVLALFLVIVAAGRRFWMKNTFDKRFLYFSAIIISAICFHRWLGYMLGQKPTVIMLFDLCITAVVCITGSLFFRPLLYLGILSALLALIATGNLSRARDFINIYMCAVFGFLLVLYNRALRALQASDTVDDTSAPPSEPQAPHET